MKKKPIEVDTSLAEMHYSQFLKALGVDVSAEHLQDTPRRVVRWHQEVLGSINKKELDFIPTSFTVSTDQLVVVTGISVRSLCSHHMLPFVGQAFVGYVPGKRLLGLSKFVRLVRFHCSKPQIQETLTEEIVDSLVELVKPRAAIVLIEADHSCLSLRGALNPGSRMITSAIRPTAAIAGIEEKFLRFIDPYRGHK